jgi:hypothetical protein
VSIRALFVVGQGRLQAAYKLPEASYNVRLVAAYDKDSVPLSSKKPMTEDEASYNSKLVATSKKNAVLSSSKKPKTEHEETERVDVGSYSVAEAKAAYSALSDNNEINGWGDVYW